MNNIWQSVMKTDGSIYIYQRSKYKHIYEYTWEPDTVYTISNTITNIQMFN